MRWIRGTANAVLMVTLVRPIARRMMERWRKQAQESPATTIGIPVQELLEAALIEELAAPSGLQASTIEATEQLDGGSRARTVLVACAVIAVVAGSAVAMAALKRRRSEAREASAEGSEWVAVPVETASETEKAEVSETLIG